MDLWGKAAERSVTREVSDVGEGEVSDVGEGEVKTM